MPESINWLPPYWRDALSYCEAPMPPILARAIRLSYRLFPNEPATVRLHKRCRFSPRLSLLWEREWAGII